MLHRFPRAGSEGRPRPLEGSLSAPIPLLAHDSPQAPVAYRAGRPIPAWQFLVDVDRVAALLPPGTAVLNACADRYRFAVGFAAAVLADRLSLLPPTTTPEVVRQIRAMNAEVICLADHRRCAINLPTIMFPETPAPRPALWQVPSVPVQRIVADIFTSGSTGLPVPHRKHWGRLVQSVRIAAQRLGLRDAKSMSVVATVPPQHMYGLENSVLLTLQSGQAFCAEHPFYPADIRGTLAAIPAPRVLITTPLHLRALLAANLRLPDLHVIVSATAPLDAALARQVEQRLKAPLMEIYGSTESGQIASRRPTRTTTWQLHPGVVLENKAERVWASGGHVETPVALGDNINLLDEEHFELGDRLQDVVNIAGKRNSIAYLNHQLLSIPGVRDGVFFLPHSSGDSATGVARLCALVVAPGLDAATVLRHLRERVDPVFLPRPLRLVDALPRNSTGKLSVQSLLRLLEESRGG